MNVRFRFLITYAVLLFVGGTVGYTSSQAADFHDYVALGEAQRKALFKSETRTVIDLSGTWQRSVNGSPQGTISLPSSDEGDGPVQYSRQIRIDESTLRSQSWHLQFFGIADEIEVRINGKTLQRFPGGTAPFQIRIPDRMLIAGSNTVELTVSRTGTLTTLEQRRVRNGKRVPLGVIRELFLVGSPHVWTSDIKTTTMFSQQGAVVQARATISGGLVERLTSSEGTPAGGSVDVQVEAVLTSPDGLVVSRSGPQTVNVERARNSIVNVGLSVANPQVWSPKSPLLYELEIRVTRGGASVDVVRSHVGLRSVRIAKGEAGRQIMLNDTAMFLHAVEYVEQYPKTGPSVSWKQLEYDVAMLKTLGVNAIRIRHAAPHPYLMYLCDRYGLFVIADLPAADIPSVLLQAEETIARMKNAAERLVAAYDNHPSLLAYNVSDGLDERSPATVALHQTLASILRKNGTHLLSKTVPAGLIAETSEGGFDLVLVRFLTLKDRSRQASALRDASRVIRSAGIVTTFGTVISPANSNGFSDPLSTESQAVVLRDCYRSTLTAGLAGAVVTSFSDYATERVTMVVDADDIRIASSGLVDQWRQRRVAYDMLKSIINDEKEPLLQARDFSSDTPLIFIATGIVLGLILVFLVNRSRRFQEYLLRALLRPYNFYADIRDQRILSTVQTAILGVVIASCVGLVLASLLHFLRSDAVVEYILHVLVPSDMPYAILRHLAWNPALSVITISVAVFGALLVVSLLLRIAAWFVKGRIFFRDTLTIAVWSSLPLVILLPIGIALYQALSADALSVWVPILVVAIIIWVFLRTLRATSVVFDVPAFVVYTVGLVIVTVSLAVVAWLYDSNGEALAYVRHFMAVVTA